MGWTREVWRGRVKEMLFKIGNTKYLESLFHGKIENYWCDFSELFGQYGGVIMSEYFDDFENEGFLSRDEKSALLELDAKVDNFLEIYDNDEVSEIELLNTSEWREISIVARGIYFKYFKEDTIDFPSVFSRKDVMEKYPLK